MHRASCIVHRSKEFSDNVEGVEWGEADEVYLIVAQQAVEHLPAVVACESQALDVVARHAAEESGSRAFAGGVISRAGQPGLRPAAAVGVEERSAAPRRHVGSDAERDGEPVERPEREICHPSRPGMVESIEGVEYGERKGIVALAVAQQTLENLGQKESHRQFGRVGDHGHAYIHRLDVADKGYVASRAYIAHAFEGRQRHRERPASRCLAAFAGRQRKRHKAPFGSPCR